MREKATQEPTDLLQDGAGFGPGQPVPSGRPPEPLAESAESRVAEELHVPELDYGPMWLRRLHARAHANRLTGLITKVVVTLVGCMVIVAGLVMMVAPGPGIVAILLGLGILSTEWAWADRWVDRARAYAHQAAEKARQMDPAVRRRRIALTVGAALVVALLVWAYLAYFGWPSLAVDGWDWVQDISPFVPDLPGM
ncbi:PGPGW domain-containing protein [Nocardioides campestrisoli]|uniref:PGPGW domain-containing protein n=1 Tax=Nocardioides campestrisoli TaxID=2736757 RepID=UPI0015E6680F|nr:PGPGW domain-containing protein [Nocardioides campestrisoli]